MPNCHTVIVISYFLAFIFALNAVIFHKLKTGLEQATEKACREAIENLVVFSDDKKLLVCFLYTGNPKIWLQI